jgi:hypothetical protein
MPKNSMNEGKELNVIDAVWVSACKLEISFSDGTKREVDFGPFLAQSDQPEIRKYLDVERFKAFEISYGNLVWNDYDLCFSIEDLYMGQLLASRCGRLQSCREPSRLQGREINFR